MGDSGTIRNNLTGFSGGNCAGLKDDSNNWLIQGNEIRGNGIDKSAADVYHRCDIGPIPLKAVI